MTATDRWLLPILARIRTRPGMFLGDERVETLDSFIAGYEQGRQDAGAGGMSSDDETVLASFDAWLVGRTQAQGDQGALRWPELLKRIDNSERNIVTFFKLFEEFLESRGDSLSKVQQWTPSDWEPRPSSIKGGSGEGA